MSYLVQDFTVEDEDREFLNILDRLFTTTLGPLFYIQT